MTTRGFEYMTRAAVKLERYAGNPILSPEPGRAWESLVATNPAAWYDAGAGLVRMLYRVAGHDAEHVVRLAAAVSRNGYDFERVAGNPVAEPIANTPDGGCLEDPRIVKMGDWYYVTVACRPFQPGQYWRPDHERTYSPPVLPDHFPNALKHNFTSTVLFLTRDFASFIRAGRLSNAAYDDRDVILFPEKVGGKFVTLHRPMQWSGPSYGTEYPAMWIAMSDDLLGWKDLKLLAKGRRPWERKIGGCAPPIRTDAGWFTLYHAVGGDGLYRIGAFLLDLEHPERILHRTPEFIFEPERAYELDGPYKGVVFPCGNVVIGDTLFVYYGGADKHCCVATCSFPEMVDYLSSCPP